jgi:NAD(P)H-nitrite reductase large subunit
LSADLVACGCRRRPAVDFLEGSGIELGRGVRVDEALRTSVADVFAAGDVAEPLAFDEFGEEGAAFCWQRAWAQGGLAAASMLDRKAEPALEAVRLRTVIFGVDLAVIGLGHLPESDVIKAVGMPSGPDRYRRLVFQDGRLIGAMVYGTGESVYELNRLVAERAPRDQVENVLGLPGAAPTETGLEQAVAAHCPICAAELVVRRSTAVGSHLRCQTCSTDLVVRWDGRRGWLEIERP